MLLGRIVSEIKVKNETLRPSPPQPAQRLRVGLLSCSPPNYSSPNKVRKSKSVFQTFPSTQFFARTNI